MVERERDDFAYALSATTLHVQDTRAMGSDVAAHHELTTHREISETLHVSLAASVPQRWTALRRCVKAAKVELDLGHPPMDERG